MNDENEDRTITQHGKRMLRLFAIEEERDLAVARAEKAEATIAVLREQIADCHKLHSTILTALERALHEKQDALEDRDSLLLRYQDRVIAHEECKLSQQREPTNGRGRTSPSS